MNDWIDITHGISTTMVVWPGNDQPSIERTASFSDGADSITSNVRFNLHDGTHCDAPLHFIAGGAKAEDIDLDTLVGPAVVIDVADAQSVDGNLLERLVPADAERVLIKSNNSHQTKLNSEHFDRQYVALSEDAAHWVAQRRLKLIGTDYLSVAPWDGSPEVHRALMRNGVQILEALNLTDVEPANYDLIALPLLICDAEAAPTRAILRRR